MYVFNTPQYEALAKEVAEKLDCPRGSVEVKDFSDGEIYHRIGNPKHLKEQDVVLIGGTTSDTEIMNMYHLASGLVACDIKKLHLVIPYFGYSTMERAIKEGEVVKAKNIARMFSGLSQATGGNFIYMISKLDSVSINF